MVRIIRTTLVLILLVWFDYSILLKQREVEAGAIATLPQPESLQLGSDLQAEVALFDRRGRPLEHPLELRAPTVRLRFFLVRSYDL